ncbi:putative uncharacterized protein C8orf89 homolog [Gracilinanus agilis]|uniref:putative uncharacterized protein C8orf89 homolog n=1 Tax=Gracilinanus agilis TaxID=191870 RepID=UPI001CFEDA8F|nr:putative uncharacterized protein C8orf89 homolog [Gracilinanus agilis]
MALSRRSRLSLVPEPKVALLALRSRLPAPARAVGLVCAPTGRAGHLATRGLCGGGEEARQVGAPAHGTATCGRGPQSPPPPGSALAQLGVREDTPGPGRPLGPSHGAPGRRTGGIPVLGEANVTVCAALVTGTRLPSRATHPGPAGDSAGLRRSDPSQWICGDGEGDGDESYTSELNYLLSSCSLKRKDRWNLQQYNVRDSQRNLSSFSKEHNKMPVLTHENRYLTSRVTKSSLDGCFIFENSWKKAVHETQKMKKDKEEKKIWLKKKP